MASRYNLSKKSVEARAAAKKKTVSAKPAAAPVIRPVSRSSQTGYNPVGGGGSTNYQPTSPSSSPVYSPESDSSAPGYDPVSGNPVSICGSPAAPAELRPQDQEVELPGRGYAVAIKSGPISDLDSNKYNGQIYFAVDTQQLFV